MATPIQSYTGQATVASKVEADDRAALRHQRQRGHGERLSEYADTWTAGGDVLPRAVEEVAAEQRLGGEADGVHHPVEAVDVLAEARRPGREVLRRR